MYPLAYNKWIQLQVGEWLGNPALYQALPAVLSVHNLASDELIHKASLLKNLLDMWVTASSSKA